MSYQDIDPVISALLFEVKKNQLKLIQKRGYNIDREKNLLSITLKQFLKAYIPYAENNNKSFRSVLTNFYENDQGKRILVYYADADPGKSQLGVNIVGDAIEDMVKYKLQDAIIITPKALSSSAYKHVARLVSYNIQVFLEEEMSYNPLEHIFTPEHIPLSPEEQQQYLKRNNLTIDQIPKILNTDVIMMYLGLQKGQLVKINRYNIFQTSIIESTSYRVVIDE